MAYLSEYRDKSGNLKSFYIRVHRGRDSSGKQLKPYCTTFKIDPSWSYKKALKEATKFAVIFESECKSNYHSASKQSLAEYIDYVIQLKKSNGTIKKRTAARWEYDGNRIKKSIGHIKLTDLKVSDLNYFYSSLDLSPKSIQEIHRLISMVLSYAVKEDLILYNIATKADVPKSIKKEPVYFQQDEIIKILKAADSENLKHKVLIYLFIFTGCRRGEIAGLRWSDIDFSSGTIYITNNVLYTPEEGVFEDNPKTPKSKRYISIPNELVNLLKELKNESNSKYVISGKSGSFIHPDSISTYLTRFAKKYNLKHINSHAFRHTMASMLYHQGVDAVSISARLGHSKVSTTSDLYSHTIKNYDNKNSKLLAQLFLESDNK